jgi:hypothetical protein
MFFLSASSSHTCVFSLFFVFTAPRSLLESLGNLSCPEVKCLMKRLLAGVHHLHDNWILHRKHWSMFILSIFLSFLLLLIAFGCLQIFGFFLCNLKVQTLFFFFGSVCFFYFIVCERKKGFLFPFSG